MECPAPYSALKSAVNNLNGNGCQALVADIVAVLQKKFRRRRPTFLIHPCKQCSEVWFLLRKEYFLVCPTSRNMARKQCFLVCPPSRDMLGKNLSTETECFLVYLGLYSMCSTENERVALWFQYRKYIHELVLNAGVLNACCCFCFTFYYWCCLLRSISLFVIGNFSSFIPCPRLCILCFLWFYTRTPGVSYRWNFASSVVDWVFPRVFFCLFRVFARSSGCGETFFC